MDSSKSESTSSAGYEILDRTVTFQAKLNEQSGDNTGTEVDEEVTDSDTDQEDQTIRPTIKSINTYASKFVPQNKLGKLFVSLCDLSCLKNKRRVSQQCLSGSKLLDIYDTCRVNSQHAHVCVHCCVRAANESAIPITGGKYGYRVDCVRKMMSKEEHLCVDNSVKTVRNRIRQQYQ